MKMKKGKKKKELLRSLPRGHAWGQGRATQVHGDKRTKRRRSRGDALRATLREEDV